MTADDLERAACLGKPTKWWFPLPDSSSRGYRMTVTEWKTRAALALSICGRCPVVDACRDEAIRDRDCQGVRGGLTPPELRRIRGPLNRPRQHGRESCYHAGCRLPECREAHRVYNAERQWEAS